MTERWNSTVGNSGNPLQSIVEVIGYVWWPLGHPGGLPVSLKRATSER
jgi:hypothetical protein